MQPIKNHAYRYTEFGLSNSSGLSANVASLRQLLTKAKVFLLRKQHKSAFEDCDMDSTVYIWDELDRTSANLRFRSSLDSLSLYKQSHPDLNTSS